jgi:DNA (cytosine-5)-methyltransferase 1
MRFIDLFSGCGGLSLGMLNSGHTGLFAVEKSPEAFNTLKHNLLKPNKFLKHKFLWNSSKLAIEPHDIQNLLMQHRDYLIELGSKSAVDLIVGGPPCQGFSTAGRRDPKDPRSKLVYDYLEVVSLVKPRFIMMENVKGIAFKNKSGISAAESIKKRLADLQYVPISFFEDCSAWGVPQHRVRFVMIGIRVDEFNNNSLKRFTAAELIKFGNSVTTFFHERLMRFSEQFRIGKKLSASVSVEDAIGDLKILNSRHIQVELKPAVDVISNRFFQIAHRNVQRNTTNAYQKYIRSGLPNSYLPTGLRLANHSEKVVKKLKMILKDIQSPQTSKKFKLSRMKTLPRKYTLERLATKKLITKVLDSSQCAATVTTLPDDLLHYDEPRILTVRECARLQSFPDWFDFTGSYTTGGERRKFSCPKYTQVGNAVPPLMAEGMGSFLNKEIEKVIKEIAKKILQ